MDIFEVLGIPYYKKGSGIHIKKKNRGKFTDYCGGKVTQECIDKAKKSGSPTLKKRAVFAENARAWKHQEGGTLNSKIRSALDQWGKTWLGRAITGFGNAQIAGDSGAATSAAVASGYKHNLETGKWEQTENNINEAKDLQHSLSVLSAFSPTHPVTVAAERVIMPGLSYAGAKYIKPMINNGVKQVKQTLRQLNPIIDDLKNIYNRYTAPKTNLNPQLYQGDQFQLMKQRLNAGGFDKIGITSDDAVYIPQSSTEDFAIERRINARQFLQQAEPVPLTSEIDGIAYYNPNTKQFTSPTQGQWGKLDAQTKVITSHEFQHAVDDIALNKNKSTFQDVFEQIDPQTNKIDLTKKTHRITPPGFDGTKVPRRISQYLRGHNGTELHARLAQLKNWYGISDPYQPITPDMWNYARRHYVPSVGMDNNMQHMFRAVTDPKKFLKWINPRVPVYAGVIGTAGLKEFNND